MLVVPIHGTGKMLVLVYDGIWDVLTYEQLFQKVEGYIAQGLDVKAATYRPRVIVSPLNCTPIRLGQHDACRGHLQQLQHSGHTPVESQQVSQSREVL